jgi:hypothetical protein
MRGLFAIGSAALLLAACSVYDSSLKQQAQTGAGGSSGGSGAGSGGTSSGGSGATSSGGADSGVCVLKSLPPHPVDVTPGGNFEIVAVQSNVDLGDTAKTTANPNPMASRLIGFDLDNLCDRTAAEAIATPGCTLPRGSIGIIDGPNGQDDSMGQLVQAVRLAVPDFSSDVYTQQLREGKTNAILRVTQYNGQEDDNQVRVEAMVSAPYNSFDPTAVPKWDGTDQWPIASDSVNGSVDNPKNVDKNGYVSGGKLVATLGDSGYRLLIGLTAAFNVSLSLQLHAAFIVCDVVPLDGGANFSLKKCTLAGRWSTDQLLQQVWRFPDPLDLVHPRPLCIGSTSYGIFKTDICTASDILGDGTKGPTALCDAISIGVNFDTEPATLGDVFTVVDMAPRCPADSDPSNDSCESADGGGNPAGAGGTGGSSDAAGASGASNGGRAGGGGRDAGSSDADVSDVSVP